MNKVKITYRLADGQAIEIEVTPEVAEALKEAKRKEWSIEWLDRKHRDNTPFEEFKDRYKDSMLTEALEDALESQWDYGVLYDALNTLTTKQRNRLIAHYFKGMTYRQIAKFENVHHTIIVRSVNAAIKKLKKHYENMAPNEA